jgi:hypothetical protein
MEKKKVFIFWDNSNIFIGAKAAAMEIKPQDDPYKLRIDFQKLLQLAAADRPIEYAIAVGSVPPELRHVWNRLENTGIKVELFERGSQSEKEQAVDQALQVHMLRKAFDYNGQAGTAVMLTGDGKGFFDGVGFQADLERMHKKGWNVEILAWDKTCNLRMREWAKRVGIFIPLEDFYESITFTDDYSGSIRHSKPVDLKNRPISKS